MVDSYRFNSADEDKRLAVEDRDGLLYWKMLSEARPLDTLLVQADSSTLYVGKAVVGTPITSPGWQIAKIVTDINGNLTKTYADGTASFSKVWVDRETYSY